MYLGKIYLGCPVSRTHQNNVHYGSQWGGDPLPHAKRWDESLTALVHWSAQCTLSTLNILSTLRTLSKSKYTQCTVQCTLYSVQHTQYTVHCTLITLYCVYAELDDFHTDTAEDLDPGVILGTFLFVSVFVFVFEGHTWHFCICICICIYI